MPAILRLRTSDNIRCALAALYRDLKADRIDINKARAGAYILSVMAGIVRDADLEARLDALESKQEAQ